MGDCINASEPTATQSGVLRPDQLAKYVELQRAPCGADIAPWVEGYWQLRWSLPVGHRYRSQVLPHPAVSLTIEHGETREGLDGETVVVTELDAGYDGLLTDLAMKHGWFDQSHFIREFSALIGTTTSAYRDDLPQNERTQPRHRL